MFCLQAIHSEHCVTIYNVHVSYSLIHVCWTCGISVNCIVWTVSKWLSNYTHRAFLSLDIPKFLESLSKNPIALSLSLSISLFPMPEICHAQCRDLPTLWSNQPCFLGTNWGSRFTLQVHLITKLILRIVSTLYVGLVMNYIYIHGNTCGIAY